MASSPFRRNVSINQSNNQTIQPYFNRQILVFRRPQSSRSIVVNPNNPAFSTSFQYAKANLKFSWDHFQNNSTDSQKSPGSRTFFSFTNTNFPKKSLSSDYEEVDKALEEFTPKPTEIINEVERAKDNIPSIELPLVDESSLKKEWDSPLLSVKNSPGKAYLLHQQGARPKSSRSMDTSRRSQRSPRARAKSSTALLGKPRFRLPSSSKISQRDPPKSLSCGKEIVFSSERGTSRIDSRGDIICSEDSLRKNVPLDANSGMPVPSYYQCSSALKNRSNHDASPIRNTARKPPIPKSSNANLRTQKSFRSKSNDSRQLTSDHTRNMPKSLSSRRHPRNQSLDSRRTASDTSSMDEYETGANGEFIYDDFVNEDEMDDFDDDQCSVTSSLSNISISSASSKKEPSICSLSQKAESQPGVKPAFWPPLFSYVQQCIYFPPESEKASPLSHEAKKLLKWKPSSICPNVIKNILNRVGFKWSKSSYYDFNDGPNDWIGYWGKHMKAECFKTVKDYQKVNHFPGTFQIGRKDRLFRNLSKLQIRYGKKEFNFFPHSFILPFDFKLLKRHWDEGGNKHKWILKPPASARGIGIRVIAKWQQIPKKRAVIVQRYLSRPYLINGSKFDLRVYVLVASYDPLRVYVHENGLVRFASMKYSYSSKSLSNRFVHLTNYSVNKNNSEYQSNTDQNRCQGHKWTLPALWGWFRQKGVNPEPIWSSIKDIAVKTIIASEGSVNSNIKAHVRNRRSCFELFGFDIILDEFLKPWILEVNISPSLHTSSPLDINVKDPMLCDVFNIVGFNIPEKDEVLSPGAKCNFKQEYSAETKHLREVNLNQNERNKHAYFIQRSNDENARSMILDVLTSDDLRILIECEDEFRRKGGFVRVFPSSLDNNKYLKYFEQPRYYNILLDQWVHRFTSSPDKGILILQNMCDRYLHINDKDDALQWTTSHLQTSHRIQSISTNSLNSQKDNNVKKKKSQASSASAAARPGNPISSARHLTVKVGASN